MVSGDVAAGPMPVETIERLMGLGAKARFIRGNADRELVAAYDQGPGLPGDPLNPGRQAVAWVASCLERPHRDFLATFEEYVIIEVTGIGQVVFCHCPPRSDEEIITVATPDPQLREMLAGVEQPLVVCGHTHMQFDRRVEMIRVVNVGSVGVPYESTPGAYWLLLGARISPRCSDYDIHAAAGKIRGTGFPAAEGMLRHLINPVDPAAAVAFFERQAGRET